MTVDRTIVCTVGTLFVLACHSPQPGISTDSVSATATTPSAAPSTPIPAVSIVDSVIRIPLKNGGEVRLVGDPRAEMQTIYTYGGHLSRTPFHGVSVQYYEASNFLLFHDSTGKRATLDDRPVESPSGARLAIASLGQGSETRGNSLTVKRVDGDSLVTEWEEFPVEWGPKDPVWSGEDTVRFLRVWAREERKSIPETPASLIRTGKVWVLRGIVPDSLPEDTTEVH